jgi:methylated-DNA-[protein]-cysteine S-methyltransferase
MAWSTDGHDGDSRVAGVAIVETRYAVQGWGVGELWMRDDDVVLVHDFHFGDEGTMREGACDGSSQAPGSRDLVARLRGFLAGADVSFSDVALDLEWATPLQRAIVEALRAVPRGEVVSYGELAALAGRPRAPRAAGAVCSANRFAFIVPCHRVVAAHGIGGYGAAGSGIKRRLLALEGVAL